jgi:hypothetical protein
MAGLHPPLTVEEYPIMKQTLAARPMLTVLLVFCVTSCASTLRSWSGHMAPDEVSKYASMSPEEFVKTHFYTEELGVFDSISDGLTKFNSKLGVEDRSTNKRPTRPALSEDGRMVLSVAYYNDTNYHQLTRPRQNLELYCAAARRGQWQQVQAYEENPIAAAQKNLVSVYTGAELQTLEDLRRRNAYLGNEQVQEQMATNTAILATRDAAALNQQIAAAYGAKGFRAALEEGAFGVFRCDEGTNSWSVSVLPEEFFSGDLSNQLDTPTLLLAIKVPQ